jgi:high-affinity K+ transport system ATPase subunit B
VRLNATSIFNKDILKQAAKDAIKKLDPRSLAKNPVMFVTECCALLTTAAIFQRNSGEPLGFTIQISVWLWFTVLFANFAEAVAEGRGKAQADSLRKTRPIACRKVRIARWCRRKPCEKMTLWRSAPARSFRPMAK